jgi:heme oxygenase
MQTIASWFSSEEERRPLREARKIGLSERVAGGTDIARRKAENHLFKEKLIRGALSDEAYGQYLTDLVVVYAALEAALVHLSENHNYRHLIFQELFRKEALHNDIKVMKISMKASSAAFEWAAFLKIAPPHHVIAHAYARQMDDLSGGMIKNKLRNNWPRGFYEFPQVRNPMEFKESYRKAIDKLNLSSADGADLVEEAKRAYQLHEILMDKALNLDYHLTSQRP